MHFKLSIFAIFFLGSFNILTGQESAKKMLSEADNYYSKNKYTEALNLLQKYQRVKNVDIKVQEKMGVCFYHTNDTENARKYLHYVIEHQKKPNPNNYYYLAKTYHSEEAFKKAIVFYKRYLAQTKITHPWRKMIKDAIRRCNTGLHMNYQDELAFVENMGEKVNTRYDEFNPVLSPNYTDKLYFSSSRKGNVGGKRNQKGHEDEKFGNYSSDIYSTIIINGEWTATTPLQSLINSPRHDMVLAFNTDGSVMYYYKSADLFSGQVFIDSFNKSEVKLYPDNFKSPMIAEHGDRTPYFFNDTTMLFASNRSGGYGGFDLYITRKTNGVWGTPINLGAQINSPYDEASPFIAKDGRTIYFSSNNLKSMGGFDIFKSRYDDSQQIWETPKNMGKPINSAEDDLHFKLASNGLEGYFSSYRKTGLGERDLYVAYFKNQQTEQSYVATPPIFLDVPKFRKQQEEGAIVFENPDPENALPGMPSFPDKEIVTYEFESLFYGADDNVLTSSNLKELNKVVNLLTAYPQLKVVLSSNTDQSGPAKFDLYFTIKRAEMAAEYLENNGVNPASIIVKGLGSNYPIAKNETESGPSVVGQKFNRRIDIQIYNSANLPIRVVNKEPVVPASLKTDQGALYKRAQKGLSYKVQIASIKQRYNSPIIMTYPDRMVESNQKSDFYQYTIGLYQTYFSAEQLKEELVRQGIIDAFVVPYINGVKASRDDSKIYSAAYPDLLNFLSATEQE